MLTIDKLIARGRGLAPALLRRATQLELDWLTRQKSRFDATDSAGRALDIKLPPGSVLRGGDVLVAEDGSLLKVNAAAQPVLVIKACAEHGSPLDLLRAAYHLGQHHVAIELQPDHLKIELDQALAGMLQRMHLIVSAEQAAFEPEGGAEQVASGHDHGHSHSQSHGHAHEDHHDHAAHEHGHHAHD